MNEYIGLGFVVLGVFYDLLACLGLVRMPDVYTRLQTSTKAVTVGTVCILIGAAIYAGPGPLAAKAFLCLIFVLLTNPASAHVIARAAHSSGIRVERVTADGLLGREIESELWDVTRKEDRYHKDRLLHIIESCTIIDIQEHIFSVKLFDRVARSLARVQGFKPEVIKEKLINREREAVTALKPDFAIPHIIVEGEGLFDLIVVRGKNGVFFSEKFPEVTSVFVISGTQDQWHFYLRTLAVIAKVVRTSEFFEKWKSAPGKKELRELLLKRAKKIRKQKENHFKEKG